METVWLDILENYIIMSGLLICLGAVALSDVLLGLYVNIGKKHEAFSWSRFWKGVLKCVVALVFIYLLTAALTGFPYSFDAALQKFGASLGAFDLSVVSVVVIFVFCIALIISWALRVISKMKDIFGKGLIAEKEDANG